MNTITISIQDSLTQADSVCHLVDMNVDEGSLGVIGAYATISVVVTDLGGRFREALRKRRSYGLTTPVSLFAIYEGRAVTAINCKIDEVIGLDDSSSEPLTLRFSCPAGSLRRQ